MPPRISIVIPCYNQGHYLKETLASLTACDKDLIEIIIVNDGSTDKATNDYIDELKHLPQYKVIIQKNGGLSAARNSGIELSSCDYILPLDSDNKIRQPYIPRAIEILDNSKTVAVVYGDAEYFDEKTGKWEVGTFNMQRLMLHNYIDACAVIRKSALREVGLYDVSMRLGWEDWDLWLRIAFAGYSFSYIPEVFFDYRVTQNSMSKSLYRNYAVPNSIENYVYEKYKDRMGPDWVVKYYVNRFRKNPVLFLVKLFIKSYLPKYYNKLLAKNKIRNGL
jgi:glycosyltransferase involved in cell wall biosynthesis